MIPPMAWEDYLIAAGVRLVLYPPEPPYAHHGPGVSAHLFHQLFHALGSHPSLILGYS